MKSSNNPLPLSVDIDITNRCNLCCTHCNKSKNIASTELSRNSFEHLINELYDLGIAEISLSGGEPLCRRDWFYIVSQACSHQGWSVILNTNGTLWSYTDIEKVRTLQYPPKIAVSLDGYTPETYSELRQSANGEPSISKFPHVIDIIQKMKEVGLYVCLNFVVTDRTARWVFDTIEMARSLGVDSFLLLKLITRPYTFGYNGPTLTYQNWKKVIHTTTNRKQQGEKFYQRVFASVTCPWELLLPLYEIDIEMGEIFKLWNYQPLLMIPHWKGFRDIGCSAGLMYCSVSADGWVMPCAAIPPEYKHMRCGNLLEENFEEIWMNSPVISSLQAMQLKDLMDCTCRTCRLKVVCGGGCRARGLYVSGSIKGPDYECPFNFRGT